MEAAPPQVETTNAAMGGLVGENAVRELPLNGRDWLQLVMLQPGVVGSIGQQSSAGFSNSRAARGNGQSLAISGNRPTANVFLVDGLVVNDYANASPGSGLNVNLGVEAIREFRVLTNEFAASPGRRSEHFAIRGAIHSAVQVCKNSTFRFSRTGCNGMKGSSFSSARKLSTCSTSRISKRQKPRFSMARQCDLNRQPNHEPHPNQ